MSFATLGLSPPLLTAIGERGYETPTSIQTKAIPAILAGRDLLAAAQTGTGKTAGFVLPMLERLARGPRPQANQARALILAPTRELATQIHDSVVAYGRHLPLRAAAVYGGVKINPQMMALRRGVDILVATPGRLLDLYASNAIRFNRLEILVLDEADRMLDLGFLPDIERILALLPARRQSLLFSATFPDTVRRLARIIARNPLELSVDPGNAAASTVKHWIHPVDKKRKTALFTTLLRERRWSRVLVFTKTREGADKLARHLDSEGFSAAAIHGDKSQDARSKVLAEFKQGSLQVLVATDLAARGLDIDQLPQVVNFDLPKVAADYIHRLGRTGRAGASGQAVSLVSADEFPLLSAIEQLLGKPLPRKLIDDFEPVHDVPESKPVHRPLKPKKSKKPKPGSNGERPSGQGRSGAGARDGQQRAGGRGAKPTAARKPTTRKR